MIGLIDAILASSLAGGHVNDIPDTVFTATLLLVLDVGLTRGNGRCLTHGWSSSRFVRARSCLMPRPALRAIAPVANACIPLRSEP